MMAADSATPVRLPLLPASRNIADGTRKLAISCGAVAKPVASLTWYSDMYPPLRTVRTDSRNAQRAGPIEITNRNQPTQRVCQLRSLPAAALGHCRSAGPPAAPQVHNAPM